MDDKKRFGSIGFTGFLTLIFITLKLLGNITWSWLWVLSPVWIEVILIMIIAIIIFIYDK